MCLRSQVSVDSAESEGLIFVSYTQTSMPRTVAKSGDGGQVELCRPAVVNKVLTFTP